MVAGEGGLMSKKGSGRKKVHRQKEEQFFKLEQTVKKKLKQNKEGRK